MSDYQEPEEKRLLNGDVRLANRACFVQSLLLVKDFGAKGQLSRSDTFLSTADVPSIVCVAVGGCRDVGPDAITNGSRARSLTL